MRGSLRLRWRLTLLTSALLAAAVFQLACFQASADLRVAHLATLVDLPGHVTALARVLPTGLHAPSADSRQPIVSLIATDLDADGDLDVVASDGSLRLFVWTNDGTGRLTRKQPANIPSARGLSTTLSSPSHDHEASTWIQNDSRPIGGDTSASTSIVQAEQYVVLGSAERFSNAPSTAHSSRAPPAVGIS